MCGIAGYFLPQQSAQIGPVRAMCEAIRHRGPDDEGFHLDGGCALGMRRLSIIDLETGHQPISNEAGTIWLVFNGEIYNFQELRTQLCGGGHRFATRTDTETLVHLYEEHGVEGLARLRGMFAFAIWDSRERQLLLARDRFGKKPLYYAARPEGLYFASELKALRAAGLPLEEDRQGLRWYLQLNYIPDPLTCFRNVRRLPAASWLLYRQDGSTRQGSYWCVPPPAEEPPAGVSEGQTCEQLADLFDESVRLRMIADVPLGAFLSGGMDSGLVVASMARQSAGPVKTFSIGFPERGFDETPQARLVAKLYGAEHHEIQVRPDVVSLVPRIVRQFDEPFGDSSAIPAFIVSEFAARHVKVVLSGDGGDEMFGGYSSFLVTQRLKRYDRVPLAWRRWISRFAERLPYFAYGKNYLHMISRPTALERYFESNYAPHFLRRRLLQPEWMPPAEAGQMAGPLAQYVLPSGADVLSQAIYFETTANLTGDMLVKVDRMSMANSLEVRCPLLDHRLAEFAARIPHAWKIRDGRGKQILRKALGARLPQELLRLPKKGFSVPLAGWFRGPLREFLHDHLTGRSFLEKGIVREPFLRYMLDEHQSGRRDNSRWLWSLLALELWYRETGCHG